MTTLHALRDKIERDKLYLRNAQEAFQNAIDKKVLSDVEEWENYAGNYMYMHSDEGKDFFKHRMTRHYIWAIYA